MKTSIGIVLLIVGLLVGALGSYMMSSGQIGSLQSQVASQQTQITTLQGSVSDLQTSLSGSEAQVTALNQQLMALQVPLITILSYPSTVAVGEHFTVNFNVTGGIPGKITHVAVHQGMSDTDISVVKGATGDTPQSFTLEVAAPNQTGPFSFRAHAVIDGSDVFSDLKTVSVETASAFTLALSTDKVVINKQQTISQGVPITVTVTSMNGFNSPVTLSLPDIPSIAVSATLSPTTVTPSANGQVTAILSVAVITGTTGGAWGTQPPFGTYTLHVVATSGTTTQSDALTVIVTNPPGTFVISLIGFAFKPSTLSVPVGSTVSWVNTDPVTHTVTSSTFDSGDLATGQSYTYVFNTAGTYSYHDKYNPSMSGTITVTP